MGLSTCDRGCQTLPEAELRNVFSAPLLSRQPHELYLKRRYPSCELEEREFCSINGVVKVIPNPHNRSARNIFKAPAEWIRSHAVLTLLMLTLLLLLAVALAVSLAAVSGRSCGDTPVTAVTLVTPDTPRLLACPEDWVGYNGICCFLSRDHLTWDQAKAQCSELGASLAVLDDKEMKFLFRHRGYDDYWLGLHRVGQRLQWVDGSNFNSSVEMKGNADCVHLAENYLGRQPCSNEMLYICSRSQIHL